MRGRCSTSCDERRRAGFGRVRLSLTRDRRHHPARELGELADFVSDVVAETLSATGRRIILQRERRQLVEEVRVIRSVPRVDEQSARPDLDMPAECTGASDGIYGGGRRHDGRNADLPGNGGKSAHA